MWEEIFQGLNLILGWQSILGIAFGVTLGITVGAIPGLTGNMAVAILLPITFYIPPWVSIPMLVGIHKGSIYGGSISAILLGVPGTPAAAATMMDGFALAKQGKGKKALKIALYASVMADTLSDLVLIFVCVPLASVALKFGPPEYTALILFALTIVAAISGDSLIKGLASGALGLLVATVGLDPIMANPRFDFGLVELSTGFSLVPVIIGVLALSQMLVQAESSFRKSSESFLPDSGNPDDSNISRAEFRGCLRSIFRGAAIGTAIGALPGIGTSPSAFLSYSQARKGSKNPEMFGKGALEGVAAAEAGNNAVLGANLIPLLSLGIPGDVNAAILLGAFVIHGMTPGPMLIKEHSPFIYALFGGLLLANIANIIIGYQLLRVATLITRISRSILIPTVLILCLTGSYLFNKSLFDIWVTLGFGIVGYFMIKIGFSPVAFVIAFILEPLFELSFRQSMLISHGDIYVFFTRPLSVTFIILAIVAALGIIRQRRRILQKE
ncbi:MAG: tripartite tricarboxylate transporter permease [Deltaproteobacteria bacterium]|nr:tripartite tricarboxylate transporter permease [Deltaproteobacteria bacterium]